MLGVIGTALVAVIALAVGAVGFYLGLKKHPKFAAKVDAEAEKLLKK